MVETKPKDEVLVKYNSKFGNARIKQSVMKLIENGVNIFLS